MESEQIQLLYQSLQERTQNQGVPTMSDTCITETLHDEIAEQPPTSLKRIPTTMEKKLVLLAISATPSLMFMIAQQDQLAFVINPLLSMVAILQPNIPETPLHVEISSQLIKSREMTLF